MHGVGRGILGNQDDASLAERWRDWFVPAETRDGATSEANIRKTRPCLALLRRPPQRCRVLDPRHFPANEEVLS
jgi:hypothetical protein